MRQVVLKFWGLLKKLEKHCVVMGFIETEFYSHWLAEVTAGGQRTHWLIFHDQLIDWQVHLVDFEAGSHTTSQAQRDMALTLGFGDKNVRTCQTWGFFLVPVLKETFCAWWPCLSVKVSFSLLLGVGFCCPEPSPGFKQVSPPWWVLGPNTAVYSLPLSFSSLPKSMFRLLSSPNKLGKTRQIAAHNPMAFYGISLPRLCIS